MGGHGLDLLAVFVGSSLRLATPMLIAGTGELVSERAGVLNLSIEGMMLTGAFAGAMGSLASGSAAIGVVAAVAAVLPLALLQAYLSNTLRANQIVSGIGLNIVVLGATTVAYRQWLGSRSRVQIPGLPKWAPPGLGDLPVVGSVFSQSVLFWLGLAVVALIAWTMRSTAIGLAVHAAGAEPRALDQSGGSVLKVRYAAVVCTGVMAALGGAFVSLGDIHTFTENMTAGTGYLALVAVIFGNWRIGRTVLRVPVLRCRDGAAVPAAGDGARRAERAADHAAVPDGAARGERRDGAADAAGVLDRGVPALGRT